MFADERRAKIADMVGRNRSVTTGELTELFQVSLETIRKDLESMEKQGLLKRVHGGEYFHEFVTSCNDAEKVLKALDGNDILGGLPIGDGKILWCVTELVSKDELDRAVAIIKEVC